MNIVYKVMSTKKNGNRLLLGWLFIIFISCNSTDSGLNESNDVYSRLIQSGRELVNNPQNDELVSQYLDQLVSSRNYVSALYYIKNHRLISTYKELYLDCLVKSGMIYGNFQIPSEVRGLMDETFMAKVDSIKKMNLKIASNTELDNRIERAELFSDLGEKDASEWDLRKAIHLDNKNRRAKYDLIMLLFKSHRNCEIVQSEELALNESAGNSYSLLVQLCDSLCSMEKAMDKIQFLGKRTRIYVDNGFYLEALNDADQLIDWNSDNSEAYALRAYIYYKLGDKQRALENIENAERLSGKMNTPLSKIIKGS